MRYTIQFYGPAPPLREGEDLLEHVASVPFEEIESDCADLAEAKTKAMEHVARGGDYAWAVAFEIMDYEAFSEGTIHDPAVAAWQRIEADAPES